MTSFHEEFVGEAWLVCSLYGTAFAWLMGRFVAWLRLERNVNAPHTLKWGRPFVAA